ncbi:hypothetical protein ACWEPL_09570 [Nonomuraea sp. NPDC004186]
MIVLFTPARLFSELEVLLDREEAVGARWSSSPTHSARCLAVQHSGGSVVVSTGVGAWLGSSTPPAPTRRCRVASARWPMRTAGAELATPRMP